MRLLRYLLFLSLSCGPSAGAERTELHLFQYGRTNTEELRTAFFDFRDLMLEKMPKLATEIDRDIIESVVARLALKPIKGGSGDLESTSERVASLDTRRLYWKETGALGVLTGHMAKVDGVARVYTVFFWGDLRGPYDREMIDLDLPVTGEAFDTTNDSHSVATLYALAHEVGADCSSRAGAFYLLSEAQKRANAVSADDPDLGRKLEELVKSAIAALRKRCDG